MTKKDLLAQLAEMGVNVNADKFDIPKLQKMIAALGGELPEEPKKKQKKRAKRPDNVGEAKQQNARILPPKKEEKKEEEPQVLLPGTYMVSFNLQLKLKNHGHTTKLVTQEVKITDETPADIVKKVAAEYVTEAYHDSEVDILGTAKVKFTEKTDVVMRDVKARAGHPLQYKLFPEDLKINKNEGQCVIDMIVVAASKAWPTFTRPQLIEELSEIAEPQDKNFLEEGVSPRHIMAWAKSKKRVTCIALNPFGHTLDKVIAQGRTDFTMTFIFNNNHVYPITDPEMMLHIAKTGKVDFKVMQYSQGCEDWCYTSEEEALGQEAKLVHVETDDLSPLLKEVVMTTGYNPVGIMSNGPMVTVFEHPVTHQVYIASQDFLQRKEVCEASLKETNYIGFRWENQSWAELWKAWVEYSIGQLPLSSYSQDSLMIRERYPQSAYIGMTREVTEEEQSQIVSYDIHKCYTSCLLENVDDFPVESVFDDIEPWVISDELLPVGKAYIARPFSLGSAKYPLGFYPSFFVEYVLDEEAIDFEDITHIQRASRSIKANTFKNLTEKLSELFPTYAKRIVNPGVGAWGKRFRKEGSVAITDSFEIALGMVSEDKEVQLSEVGNSFWFMRKEKKELLFSGHIGLREHIVCMGHIKLHKMEKAVLAGGGEVIAYNTDSIKVLGGDHSVVAKQPGFVADKALARPGDFCLEGKCNLRGQIISQMKGRTPYIYSEREWIDVTAEEAQMGGIGAMVVGAPGFGKSYLLKKAHEHEKANELQVVKLTWTKTAALNISGGTLDHVFPQTSTRAEWIAKGLTYDGFSFDEFTIIPVHWWSLFMQLKMLKPKLTFRFFGDPQQLHSHDYEDSSATWHRYDLSRLMHFLTDGRRLKLSYQSATARYDEDMKQKLDSFEATLKLDAFGEKSLFGPDECDFNIVKNPQKRKSVNDEWVAHHRAGKKTVKCGNMVLWEGMYLISHKNDKVIVNSTRYLVKKIGEMITLENEGTERQVSFEQVARTCQYGYADTVMRVISRTIPGRLNVHEAAQMDWNEMFVALSRARTAASIGISYKPGRTYSMASPPAKGGLVKLEPALFKGEIYSRTDDEFTYIGSSMDAKKREQEHKDKAVSKKTEAWQREKGDKIVTTVIESYLCASEKQLVKREYELIAKVPADKCMNTNGIQKIAAEKCATKVSECEITYSRFKITDDVKGKRLRIRWRDHAGAECTKDFSYRVKSQADQMKAAETFRAGLIKEYLV